MKTIKDWNGNIVKIHKLSKKYCIRLMFVDSEGNHIENYYTKEYLKNCRTIL
jgi:hypothetical protein